MLWSFKQSFPPEVLQSPVGIRIFLGAFFSTTLKFIFKVNRAIKFTVHNCVFFFFCNVGVDFRI
jgi:hypothetical protein